MSGMRNAVASISDLHLRADNPRCRKDNAVKALFKKLEYVFSVCKKRDIPLIIAGDLFNISSLKCPYWVVYDFVDLIKDYEVDVFAVFGQHDQRYHNEKSNKNTPYGVLSKTETITHLSAVPTYLNGFAVYGKSFEQDSFEIIKSAAPSILVTHEMVIDEKLWKSQKNYIKGNKLLKAGFDIVISGDNHKHFSITKKNKLLINNGSILRSTISQQDHEPRVSIVSLKGDKPVVDILKIPIQPDVFKETKESENNLVDQENFDEVIKEIASLEEDSSVVFKKLINRVGKENKIKAKVKKELADILENIHGN